MLMTDETSSAVAFRAAAHPLWESLKTFDFDAAAGSPGSDPPLRSFSRRLAGEQGWSPAFTARVLEEYRRFLFLTAVAGEAVCPSEEVDAAWHLHLIFTRSYWDGLCGKVLGRPLHHNASAGGPAEGAKHRGMYRRTLRAYREWFGGDPPADIWPPVWRRFDPRSRHRTIDLRDHWIIRRPGWWRGGHAGRMTLATVPVVAAVPLVADGLGPLDWKGPEFLLFYGLLWLACLVGTLIYRSIQCNVTVNDDRELTAEEVACLAHGPKSAIRATVAGMLEGGELTSESCGGLTSSATNFLLQSVATDAPLDGAIAAAIREACTPEARSLAAVEGDSGVEQAVEQVRNCLRADGWLLDEEQRSKLRTVPVGAFSCLLLLGLVKVAVGLERHKPVEFLVVASIATLAAMIWAAMAPRQSLAARHLLANLRAQHRDRLADSAPDLVLLAGLFGAVALTGSELATYKKVWRSSAAQGDGGGCGSGCGGGVGGSGCGGGGDGGGGDGGGGDGGGGDGGGGGCGGGGCGGCGGD